MTGPSTTSTSSVSTLTLLFALVALLGQAPRALADDIIDDTAPRQGLLERPGADAGPTRVSVFMWVVGLDAIDSASQSFTGNVFVAARWHDPRLAGEGRRTYPLNAIWTPNFIIANVSAGVRATLPALAEVDPDGNVVMRQRVVGTFTQPMVLQDFPFDRQTLRLRLVSPTSAPEALELVPDERLKDGAGVASNLALPDWTVERWTAGATPYELAPGISVAGYDLRLEVRRHASYFLVKVIAPLMLIILMSWSVFFLEPGPGGPQIGIATTSMLTLIAYRFAIDGQVPRVSYLTRLDAFVIASTFLVFLTLGHGVLGSVLVRHDRAALARTLNRYSRWVFLSAFLLVALWTLLF